MSNTSKKRIAESAERPARRARRPRPVPVAENATAMTDQAFASPAAIETAEAVAAPLGQPSSESIAQLAFTFFADSGFVDGHALEHWLRAEAELAGQS